MKKEKIFSTIKKAILFLTNPKLLLCLAIAWMITNGWSYIVFALGTALGITWMVAVGGAYLAFLWLPISPEKIVTVAIAIFLLKWLFPNDQKTLRVLNDMYQHLKSTFKRQKEKRAEQKRQRRQERNNIQQ